MRRLKSSYLIAFVIAAAAVAWIVSGQMARKDDRAEAAAPTAAADAAPVLPKVRVAQRTAQPHRAEIVLRGRTEAVRSVDLRAETRGKIVEILAEKGASVRAGDVLLRLAADDRMAKLRQANALLAQRQIEYDSAKTLSAKGYRADTEVAAAEARLEEAKAHVASMEIDIGYTTIAAPFDGVVEARAVEIGHFVDIGDVMLRLVDLDPILVVGQVSEQDVAKLKPGMAGVARLVTSEQAKGRLRYLAATADESTRTFRVELEVANPERRIMQGLSTELRLPVEEVPAHLVSPAILTLNEAGQIGVKTVGADGRVEFHPVRIVGDGPSGVWLTGLPAQATVITVGQEFVNAGQQVETVPEGAAEPQS